MIHQLSLGLTWKDHEGLGKSMHNRNRFVLIRCLCDTDLFSPVFRVAVGVKRVPFNTIFITTFILATDFCTRPINNFVIQQRAPYHICGLFCACCCLVLVQDVSRSLFTHTAASSPTARAPTHLTYSHFSGAVSGL